MLSVLNCLRECEIAVLARRHLAALPAPYDLDGGSRLLAPDWYFTGIDIASFTVEGEHVAFSEAMVHRYPSFGQSIPIGRLQDVARSRVAPYWQPSILHVSETPGAELRLIFFEKLVFLELILVVVI